MYYEVSAKLSLGIEPMIDRIINKRCDEVDEKLEEEASALRQAAEIELARKKKNGCTLS